MLSFLDRIDFRLSGSLRYFKLTFRILLFWQILAVSVEAVFEIFDLCAQDVVLLQDGMDQRENGVWSLAIDRLELVAREHSGFHASEMQRAAPGH